MKISERLFNHIEQLQAESDRKASYQCYPEHQTILPNDAIYFVRSANLKAVCQLIEDLVSKSGKPLDVVLSKSIAPNLGAITAEFPHISEALNVIIRDFAGAKVK